MITLSVSHFDHRADIQAWVLSASPEVSSLFRFRTNWHYNGKVRLGTTLLKDGGQVDWFALKHYCVVT